MAASQQHWVDNRPLATFWDLPFSDSDASIPRKSCSVNKLKAAFYPWESWSEFLVADLFKIIVKVWLPVQSIRQVFHESPRTMRGSQWTEQSHPDLNQRSAS